MYTTSVVVETAVNDKIIGTEETSKLSSFLETEAHRVLKLFWNNRITLLETIASNLKKTLMINYIHSSILMQIPEFKDNNEIENSILNISIIDKPSQYTTIRLSGTDNDLYDFEIDVQLKEDKEDLFGQVLLKIMKGTSTDFVEVDGYLVCYEVIEYIITNKLGGIFYV